MLINNVDIVNFNSLLLKKDIQTSEVIIFDDWLKKALNPLFLGKEEKYKSINIQLLVESIDDETCLNLIGALVLQFEKCNIKFKDLSFYYDCVIVSKVHKRIRDGIYTLDVELKSGYAYKTLITEAMNRVTTKTLNVAGNLETLAIVEITPSVTIIDIVLNGLGEDPITIKNLTAGKKVIINGEDGTVTVDGVNKFGDTDMWNFPSLKPGANIITVSRNNVDINIKYKPKYI